MAEMATVTVVIKVKVKISLIDAIKMRIAGKYIHGIPEAISICNSILKEENKSNV